MNVTLAATEETLLPKIEDLARRDPTTRLAYTLSMRLFETATGMGVGAMLTTGLPLYGKVLGAAVLLGSVAYGGYTIPTARDAFIRRRIEENPALRSGTMPS